MTKQLASLFFDLALSITFGNQRDKIAGWRPIHDGNLDEEQIARLCYDADTAYRKLSGYSVDSTPWHELPLDERLPMLAMVACYQNGTTVKLAHQNWLDQKKADGWSYGYRRDNKTKKHPLCMPFDDLPTWIQRREYLMHALVRAANEPVGDPLDSFFSVPPALISG